MRFLAAVPGLLALIDWLLRPRDPGLRVRLGELEFRTPLGVAAGLDKNATWFGPLTALGFGAVEVGTATAQPQPGTPRHVTRLYKDRGLINAMGFPNEGAEAIAARAARRRKAEVLGINIGKSKVVELDDAVADYRLSARILAPYADYLALNVSSPNTPGLRQMQSVERLGELIAGVREELHACGRPRLPLLVKLAPDLADAEIEAIAALAIELGLAGIIATNTTVDASVAANSAAELAAQSHGGGVSGRPLKARSLEVLRLLHATTGGQMPLVSVGGIESGDDAWERVLAGATLLQAYTAFVYEGPLWAHRVNRGLSKRLRDSQWSTLAEAVGASAASSPAAGRR
jgi:dihydroorotate dehydrogenase